MRYSIINYLLWNNNILGWQPGYCSDIEIIEAENWQVDMIWNHDDDDDDDAKMQKKDKTCEVWVIFVKLALLARFIIWFVHVLQLLAWIINCFYIRFLEKKKERKFEKEFVFFLPQLILLYFWSLTFINLVLHK